MDILLVAITVVSVIVAVAMTAMVWRSGRDERARSAARVAALVAAATAETAPASTEQNVVPLAKKNSVGDEFPTESSLPAVFPAPPVLPAAVAAPAVVRTRAAASASPAVHETRPWPPARAAALAPDMVEDLPLSTGTQVTDRFLGSTVVEPAGEGRQRRLATAAVVLFLALIAGGYWYVVGDRASAARSVAAVSDKLPLELVSLRHERRGPRLAVTGLVRNPSAGGEVKRLAAVVFLFDQQGAFITSARADVDFITLSPGDESPFVIGVEAPNSVTRYRVSFRDEAGVVPHVDRRGEQPIATTGALR